MALPQHKTTLSILRSILGPAGSEARFADKIGRSTSWLRKACCGQIPLMREAALSIVYETGISLKWLMDGDTAKPPVDAFGLPYTLETYAHHNAQQSNGVDRLNDAFARLLASYCATSKGDLLILHFEAFADEMSRKFRKGSK